MRNRYGFSCSWFYSSVFAFDRVHKNGSDFPRTMTTANSLARLKMEELKNSARTPGGSLTSDAASYFDKPNFRYTRRWQISADSMGTQTVVVLMKPKCFTHVVLPEIRLTTRMN
jgi:hypothetical protein